MNFLTPHQPFGMIVVANSPVATGTTVDHLISSWRALCYPSPHRARSRPACG